MAAVVHNRWVGTKTKGIKGRGGGWNPGFHTCARSQGGRISQGMALGNNDGAFVGIVQLYPAYLNKSNQGRLWQRTREQDICRYARNGMGGNGRRQGYKNCCRVVSGGLVWYSQIERFCGGHDGGGEGDVAPEEAGQHGGWSYCSCGCHASTKKE